MSLPADVDQVVKLAREAGLRGAAHWIEQERMRRWPIRDWELGACIWCEAIDGKRRKAIVTDPGGGPPTCARHEYGADEIEAVLR